MAANSADMFTGVGSPGSATTLAAPGHLIGGTDITVVATTNWETDTGVIFAMDTVTIVNGVEVRDTGSYTEWEGVVSGATTITGMVLRYGTDQNYPAGATTRVYIPVSSSRENRLVDGLLVTHNQDGTIKNGVVTLAMLATTLKDALYPVGSIYTNAAVATNPATLLGFGTWTTFGAGRVMVGLDAGQTEFDVLEETGGAKTHTLSVTEMPAHNHPYKYGNTAGDGSGLQYSGTTGTATTAFNPTNIGGGGAHNNLQPYIVVYMWKRTA